MNSRLKNHILSYGQTRMENIIYNELRIVDVEKMKQKKAPLINVNDAFKKIINVKDVINVKRDEDGITMMSVY